MGATYTNFTLKGPSQQEVAQLLAGRSALVTPERKGCVVVYDEESEGLNTELIGWLGSRLSYELKCPLLAVMVYDDDFLWYQLYQSGELVDVYSSCPDNFESMDQEVGPVGGDVEKLSKAFGSKNVSQIERILRTSFYANDGYIFATELHSELVDALGIPEFGVAAGFEYVKQGELPRWLEEGDVLETRALQGLGLKALTNEEILQRYPPGYYKSNFSSISLEGLIRLQGLANLAETYKTTRNKKPRVSSWSPELWDDLACQKFELSEQFWNATATQRENLLRSGFTEVGYKKLPRVIDPSHRDSGGINYLTSGKEHFAQIIYNRRYLRPPKNKELETIIVSFSAILTGRNVSCTNNVKTHIDSLPDHTVERVDTDDVMEIYKYFQLILKHQSSSPIPFVSVTELQEWFDRNALLNFENRIRRGLSIRMTDEEVHEAKRQLESPPL